MALTEITIGFDLHTLLGGDFDARRTKAYVTTNVESGTLMDTSTGETRLGDEAVTIAADGTGSFTTWATGADGNPISWQTSLVVDYPRTGQRDRKRRVFGPYTLTAADDGGNITDLEDEQAVPAEYLTSVTTLLDGYVTDAQAAETNAEAAQAAAEAARDDAVDISGISTPDGVVEALVKNTGGAGPLTSAALSATFVPRALEPIKLDSSYSTTAKLDALLATLSDGAVLEIPPGVTISRSTELVLPVKVEIKGEGRLHDARSTPTGPFVTGGVAAAGSRVRCRMSGSVLAGTYVANHHAVQFTGTDNGAGVAPTYVTDVVVDSPEITGFGALAVYGEFVENGQFDIGNAHDLGFGGVIIRSGKDCNTHLRSLHNVTPGPVGAETYGIQYDRRDATNDLVRYPHSQNCHGRIDVAFACSAMNMLGTHGGQGIHLSWGVASGIKRVLDIVPASGTGGSGPYAPNNITFDGGYANSGVTDGSGEHAIAIVGAYAGSAVVEYAKGISGRVGTLEGYGHEGDATSAAVYCHSTRGLDLTIGNARESSPYAVIMYHDNLDFTLRLGSVMDSWSNTYGHAGMVNIPSGPNTGWILSASSTPGGKSAAIVNSRGLNIASGLGNVVRLGHAADFTGATLPINGTLSTPYQRPILPAAGSAAAPAYSFDGDPDTGFFSSSADQLAVAVGGTMRARFLTTGGLSASGYGWDYNGGTVEGVHKDEKSTPAFAAAQTVSWSLTNLAVVTLTANMTSLTFSNPTADTVYELHLVQDATGSRTLAGSAASIKWAGGSAPTLTTTASKRDIFRFRYDGTNYYEISRTMNLG